MQVPLVSGSWGRCDVGLSSGHSPASWGHCPHFTPVFTALFAHTVSAVTFGSSSPLPTSQLFLSAAASVLLSNTGLYALCVMRGAHTSNNCLIPAILFICGCLASTLFFCTSPQLPRPSYNAFVDNFIGDPGSFWAVPQICVLSSSRPLPACDL